MNIYVLAATKDKIAKLGITDPFIIFFIYGHETSINWDLVKKDTAEADINNQIKSQLIPKLFYKIDSMLPYDPKDKNNNKVLKNNYVKDISDIAEELLVFGNLQGGGSINKEITECKETLLEKGHEAAKQLRIKQINDAKKEQFNKWWDNFHEGAIDIEGVEPNYNPAFAYILLKTAFDGSKANDKTPTFKINRKAILSLSELIKNSSGKNFNLQEAYQEVLVKSNLAEMERDKDNPDNGWLRLKSKINDPVNYEDNLQKLIEFSAPSGWCTGAGYGEGYLSYGDFWLYIENNAAKVAIRFDRNDIAEIRGQRNKDAYGYYKQIFDLINKHGFTLNATGKTFFNTLKVAEETNQSLENNTLQRPILFLYYIHLTEKNRKNISEEEIKTAINAAATNVHESYLVAQFYDFDLNRIGNNAIIDKIAENKISTDNASSNPIFEWQWEPWKWVSSVKFKLERIPDKIIECIAHNGFTAFEFAKRVGFNPKRIPASIISKIAESPDRSFAYAQESLYHLPFIPEALIQSIAKNDSLFLNFALKSGFDLKNIEEKYMPAILKSPELCAIVCKNYDFNKTKIPSDIWAKVISDPFACIKFAEVANFDASKIPPEIFIIISNDLYECIGYSEKAGWNKENIPDIIAKKISQHLPSSEKFIREAGYNFSMVPEIIIDAISTDIHYCNKIIYDGSLFFDELKTPVKFLERIATDPMIAVRCSNASDNPHYKLENIPKILIDSIASSPKASATFAFNRRYAIKEIPKEIIDSLCKEDTYSYKFATSVIDKWKDLNIRDKFATDFIVEREIPQEVILSIARSPDYSIKFAEAIYFDVPKIPNAIKDAIGNDSKSSLLFASGVGYNYAKLTTKMTTSISEDYHTAAEFIAGVGFNKNNIDPRMMSSISEAFKSGKRDFNHNVFKQLLAVSGFDLTIFDKETSTLLISTIITDPNACLSFAKAKNAVPSQIPPQVLNSIASDSFVSLEYAKIAQYNLKKIPAPIITSIARSPDYSFSYAQGCNFNFYMIPKEILQGISTAPKLMAIVKQKYAEFKAREAQEEAKREMGTEPSKITPIQTTPAPITPTSSKDKLPTASSIKIIKLANKGISMPKSIKITKIAKHEVPTAETLALCVLTLKVYLKDNENIPEEYKRLIEKLPAPRKIRQEFSLKECEVLYETVEFLWKKITGQEIIPEETIQKAPEKMCGNYLLINNGILLKGVNTHDIIKRNIVLLCSLLDISGMVIQEYLSGNPNDLVKFIIKSGAVRLFITKDGRVYGQCSPETYGRWARKKIQKLDFKKKVLKIIDLNTTYLGWHSGITIIL